jgi:hypothetical protein
MRNSKRRAALVIGSVLALSLLFNSVVYACSKLGSVSMAMAMHGPSMPMDDGTNGGAVERGPCADHKQDICKSVRDRMVSVQLSLSKVEDYQQFAPPILPLNFVIAVPKHIAFRPPFCEMGDRFSLGL